MILGVILTFFLLVSAGDGKLMSKFTLERRTLERFKTRTPQNQVCWDRNPDKDSFFNVIDTHNHFRPFGGPPVPFDTYYDWMKDAGILFTTIFGIGQKIAKKKPSSPDCCYYLHCPTFDHLVVPFTNNDRENAKDYVRFLGNKNQSSAMNMVLSATFPNLQRPGNIMKDLNRLNKDFPGAFKWAGEINVIKHALVGNGFFKEPESPRLTKKFIDDGNLDPFFREMESKGWPVTLHCDIGCDNYDAIPKGALDNNPIKYCDVPESEWVIASQNSEYWKEMLGEFYPAFFNTKKNEPKACTFRKIQHLPLMDTICDRYPNMKVVWPHMALSKELRSLHPRIHTHIFENLFKKHRNLYIDISWDILAKLILLNYDDMESVEKYSSKYHSDIHDETTLWNDTHVYRIDAIREKLHEKWDQLAGKVHSTGSASKLNGPTHAFVIYLDLMERYPDRFLTGTDFVSSMGEPLKFPGMKEFKETPTGCMKDEANHLRQVTDTSAINIFLNDESFRKIVLGENYFKITGMDKQGFKAPEMCLQESPIDSSHSSSASALTSPIDVLRNLMIFTSQSIFKVLFHLLSISPQ